MRESTRSAQPTPARGGLTDGAVITWASRSRRLAWLPVLLFVASAAAFYWTDTGIIYESQVLLATLNTLFSCSVSAFVVYLAARSYLRTGSRAVLTLGCGALIFAVINLLVGIILPDRNLALTVYNSGVFLAGLCFVMSAFWAVTQKPREKAPVKARNYLIFSYGCIIVALSALVLAAVAGFTPDFYVPGEGNTSLRQAIMALTVIEFVLTSACFLALFRQSRTPFLLWYSLGLLLIGLGIGTVAISTNLGTLLNWTGRGGQYLGAIYILVAVWTLKKSSGDLRIPLEKALKETEEKYRTIVETATEGIWMTDAEGKTTFVNHRMAEMLGVRREDMLGRELPAFTDDESLVPALRDLDGRRQGAKESREYRLIRKDGSVMWALVSTSPMTEKDGTCSGSMSLITDISKRKQTEDALIASERDLSRAQSIAHLGFWVWDVEKDRLQWSDETYRIMGLAPQQLSPDYKTFIEFVHPDDREMINRSVADAIKGAKSYDVEWRLLRQDGTIRHAHSQGEVIVENGRPTRMLGTILDITERKLAEEALRVQAREMEAQLRELRAANAELEKVTAALRESEETARRHAEELEKLMDLVPAAIWVSHDPHCHVIGGNRAANQFYEANEGDNVSAGPADLRHDMTRRFFRNGRELMPDELTMQEAAAKGVDVHNSELEVLLPSGRWMTILGNASPLRDADGNVRGCVGAFVDITDRKRAEKELLEAKMQAELYLDLMGHDINNMHQIAIGYLELAREMLELDDGRQHLIDKPLETLQRSAKLIDNVRKLQKVQTGDIREEETDLADVLAKVVADYRNAPGVMITCSNSSGPCQVMGNVLLYDVFANLVANAIKHAEGSDTQIALTVDDIVDSDKSFYRISVEDNGPGIPDDLKDKVFNRLQRGRSKARGVGLGLYLVKSLVDSCHGRVWVEDRVPGDYAKGSRFVVILPAI